jgi:hypothetical protein
VSCLAGGKHALLSSGDYSLPTDQVMAPGGQRGPQMSTYSDMWGANPAEVPVPANLRNAATWSIARAGDGVRIAYPSRKEKQSSLQTVKIIFVRCPDPTKPPEVRNIAEIEAKDPKGHVLYATFIESDRVKLSPNNPPMLPCYTGLKPQEIKSARDVASCTAQQDVPHRASSRLLLGNPK